MVRAAGAIVWRRAGRGLEVLLVHRPRYDDWSFPKGKAAPGESDAACALREVEEETGLRAELGAELGSTSYRDGLDRPKTVVYFAVEADREPWPQNEIDEVRWATVREALELLTWGRDRELLEDAEYLLG